MDNIFPMRPRFVLRFDDVAPGMACSKFSVLEVLARELDIRLLLGVVPNCLDPKLEWEPARADFWDMVRQWSSLGWTIAQHGHTHRYVNRNPGLLGISHHSEFAGLAYDEQFSKLKAGKEILVQQGVWQPVFMAPSHSFDVNTLKALVELGFSHVTDGYGLYPYRMGTLTAVPQLFGSPLHFGFGVYTVCLHVNTLSQAQMDNMVKFIKLHRRQFISFDEASAMRCPVPGIAAASRLLTSVALRSIRALCRRRRI